MGDVSTFARSGSPMVNNGIAVGNRGYVQSKTYGINQQVPISGLNSSSPDILDDRFDDPRYYAGPPSEEYTAKGY